MVEALLAGGKIIFSESALAKLKPPMQGRDLWSDLKTSGLMVRVTPAGTITFIWCRRPKGGKLEWITMARWPEMSVEKARVLAGEYNQAAMIGESPAAIRKEQEAEKEENRIPTLGELFEIFLDRWSKPRKRSWKQDEDIFRLYFRELENTPATEITRKKVTDLHIKIGERHQVAANRALALLSAIFGRAKEWELWNGENPCIGVRRFPERSRTRFFSTEETERLLAALREEELVPRAFFLISMLTGVRRSNMQEARWSEIDLQKRSWRIERTKNEDPLTVHLVPVVVRILDELRQAGGDSPWVFPSPKSSTGHLVEPRSAWERVIRRAGIEKARVHDLRHFFASNLARAGASLLDIGASLGHRPGSPATRVYLHLVDASRREAMERAADSVFEKIPPIQE